MEITMICPNDDCENYFQYSVGGNMVGGCFANREPDADNYCPEYYPYWGDRKADYELERAEAREQGEVV